MKKHQVILLTLLSILAAESSQAGKLDFLTLPAKKITILPTPRNAIPNTRVTRAYQNAIAESEELLRKSEAARKSGNAKLADEFYDMAMTIRHPI